MAKNKIPSFALLGSGRVARHFHFYFKNLGLPLQTWSRNGDPQFNTRVELAAQERLNKIIESSTHILCAIKDAAVSELVEQNFSFAKTWVHFSGALQLPKVHAAHPLMTFGDTLEELDWYRQIPFILDEGDCFEDLLPGLANPSWRIPAGLRPLYHALCSLAGNSTFLLWKNIGDEFERTLGLPRALLTPFLHQVVTNSSRQSSANFTGPVARGDWQTVRHHLDTLLSRPKLLNAYKGYLELANQSGHLVPEVLL